MRTWLWLTAGSVVAAMLYWGLQWLEQQGVPLAGIHGWLLWIEILLVPVTILMTLVVVLAARRKGSAGP